MGILVGIRVKLVECIWFVVEECHNTRIQSCSEQLQPVLQVFFDSQVDHTRTQSSTQGGCNCTIIFTVTSSHNPHTFVYMFLAYFLVQNELVACSFGIVSSRSQFVQQYQETSILLASFRVNRDRIAFQRDFIQRDIFTLGFVIVEAQYAIHVYWFHTSQTEIDQQQVVSISYFLRNRGFTEARSTIQHGYKTLLHDVGYGSSSFGNVERSCQSRCHVR